jgi:hypothetical protein
VFYLSDRDPTSNGSIVEQFALASTTSTVVARVADDPLRPRGEICIATPSTSIILPVTTEPDGPGTMLQTVTIPVQEAGAYRHGRRIIIHKAIPYLLSLDARFA